MRRSNQGAIALLSVLLVAGCSAPAPAPSESPEPPVVSTPTPSATPDPVVDWSLPATCENAVWPSLQRELDDGVQQLEPLTFDEYVDGLLPEDVEGIACTNFIPNSDGLSRWAVARVPIEQREQVLDTAEAAGYEPKTDLEIDGVRFVTVMRPDQLDEDGLLEGYGDTLTMIGDAWLHIDGATVVTVELLRELGTHLELPLDVGWLVPIDCADQALSWSPLTEEGRIGEASMFAENRSSVERLPAVATAPGDFLLECAWAADADTITRYTAELFTTVGRLSPPSRAAVLDELVELGWEVVSDSGDRADVILTGDSSGAGILTGDGIVLAEPLESADTELVEPFARSLGMLD